ncbi:MAG: bifunctional folylpolyglutamate synthase/dihydrofolate synthase [Fibrobacter sp.]|nr:bifunctional folylpolyglutamate synthase/dihydrofolate synthase [Fibrobacter sp.]
MQNAGMEYLETRLMFGMVPGLTSTRKICETLGNPEKKFKSIHVVGTNGKGSTSFYLAGILQAHGLKAGLYTSPHLVNLRERIRVNDLPIGDADLNRLILKVKEAAEKASAAEVAAGGTPIEPTFFEVLTIVAFLYYAEQGVDVAVLEAGMGGRLDSTAVADGRIAVVTSIGLEHTEVLGATESAILKEKMGVVGVTRAAAIGKVFVLGGLSEDLLDVAREISAKLMTAVAVPIIRNDIELPNLGQHYVENACLSLVAAKLFLADCGTSLGGVAYDDSLAVGCLRNRSWAGRMQKLMDAQGNVRVILDGAHNSHAVFRLVQTLAKYYPGKKFHCVFGALKDKDVGVMLKLMAPYVSHWHITKTPYPRFRELSDLRGELAGLGLNVASEGELSREYIDAVMNEIGNAETLLITGSLYMIGASIELLKNDFDGLSFFRGLTPTTNEHR